MQSEYLWVFGYTVFYCYFDLNCCQYLNMDFYFRVYNSNNTFLLLYIFLLYMFNIYIYIIYIYILYRGVTMTSFYDFIHRSL